MWRWQVLGCRGNSHHPQIKCAQADLKPVRQLLGLPPIDLAGELAGLDMPQDPKFIDNSRLGISTPPPSPPDIVFRKGVLPSYGIDCAGVSQRWTEVMMVGWLKSSSEVGADNVNASTRGNQPCFVSIGLLESKSVCCLTSSRLLHHTRRELPI